MLCLIVLILITANTSFLSKSVNKLVLETQCEGPQKDCGLRDKCIKMYG